MKGAIISSPPYLRQNTIPLRRKTQSPFFYQNLFSAGIKSQNTSTAATIIEQAQEEIPPLGFSLGQLMGI